VDGRRYLVLEFVDGETLAERIARGPLPVADALDVCRQIAAAVETAHESGVIHRDLKPANVKLTPGGVVKVLDFGLARGTPAGDAAGTPSDLSASPTAMLSMTGAGVILGTAAYMSPEQARGKPVDRRTDIWSFGCVLYECLTGRQLFDGETVSDLIARILEREPDWGSLPPATPPRVRELLRRCLEKDAKRRLRDIGDARIELEEIVAGPPTPAPSDPSPAPATAARPKSRRAEIAWTLVGAIAGAVASVVATKAITRWSPPPAAAPVRFSIAAPRGTTIVGDAMEFSISPDGRTLVFTALDSVSTGHLWLRPLDTQAARMLPGTDNPSLPFWSPDGRWIGFFADGKLKRIPAAGGTVEALADANNGRGASWNRDGVIVFAPAGAGPLFKIEREGDPPVAVTTLDSTRGQNGHRYPCFLPDGRHFLYAALPPRQGKFEVFVGSLAGGAPRSIGSFDACPIYVDPGLLLHLRGQTVVAQRFDPRSLRLLGEPVALGETPGPTQYSGAPSVSASAAGVAVTLGGSQPNTALVMIDRTGNRRTLAAPDARYDGMDFSPDASRVVLLKIDDRATQDLWILDIERGTLSRFTYGEGRRANPVWSPDGRHIAYSSDREGPYNIYVRPIGGSGEETPLFLSPTPFKYPGRWSADGSTLVAETLEEKTGWDLWTVSLANAKPAPYLSTPFNERWGAISPDGRWMAYTSDESGRNEIYVQSFPVPEDKHQVSTGGGFYSSWRRDGKELAYYNLEASSCMVVDVGTGDRFSASAPRPAFLVPPGVQYSMVTPDHDRMLAAVPGTSAPPSLNVLLNWKALLRPARR
jgi:Tol biopolymer transport system component